MLRSHAIPPHRVGTVAVLDMLGSRFTAAARAEMISVKWSRDPLFPPNEVIRARQLIDDWLYAGAFHCDDPARVARVTRFVPAAYESLLGRALDTIVRVIWQLDVIVAGALGKPTSPTRVAPAHPEPSSPTRQQSQRGFL